MPLGYRVKDRKLIVEEEEAKIVRLIFELYLTLSSMLALMQELRDRGIVTRQRKLSSGRIIGGTPFTKGPLAYLLKNRMYLGEINHGQQSYRGEHPAIIDRELFDTVQARLAERAAASGYKRSRSEALLIGKLFDDRGHRMTPSFAVKQGVRYRYYLSRATPEGRNGEAGSISRAPAPEVERAVLDALDIVLLNNGAAEAGARVGVSGCSRAQSGNHSADNGDAGGKSGQGTARAATSATSLAWASTIRVASSIRWSIASRSRLAFSRSCSLPRLRRSPNRHRSPFRG